jgi:ferritin
MLKKKVETALNDQLNKELYSGYLYLSMAAYFESINLAGFANWMRVQAQEELVHAMKFYDFISEREGRVMLKAVAGPETQWKSPRDVFEQTYKHEILVTKYIHKLVDIAEAEGDHATKTFLDWFVTEQVEEEASASTVLENVKLVEKAPGGLFMLDRELAQRVFTPPVTTE